MPTKYAELRADSRCVDAYFLFYLLRSEAFQDGIGNFASTLAQPQISITDLKEITTLCPPLALQESFAARVSSYENLIATLQSKNIGLRERRDLLLPRLISGELYEGSLE